MATFEERPKIELEIVLRLNETEARFLEGLAGFEHKVLLEALRAVVGSSYTGSYEAGFFSLMQTAQAFRKYLEQSDEARAVFNRQKRAVTPRPESS